MNTREVPYITRVLVPQRRTDILRRDRLIDFLHEQVECRLILISAPAGYGKTTLLVDFVQSIQSTVCFYSLSEADKDPKVFFEYLVASIRQRFPGFGERTLALLDKVTDLSKDFSSVVGVLVNEIHDSIPEFFFIVLDDYHHADDSPVVNEALDLLLYYLPTNCHIVLSTRTLPKLTLSRLAAQRMVAGLGTSDLRFTMQEIRDFLRISFKLLLPDALAHELADSSEGWITGIVLSTYGLGQGMLETIIRARNSGGPVFDFMANEVFMQQPEEIRSFLLETSLLRQFNTQSCVEILGIDNPRDLLKSVEERNLFISRAGSSDWYQYHNLFTEYLRSKLKTEYPERYKELSQRAGEIFYRRGELDDAVHHYAGAGRYDKGIEIIERTAEEILDAGKMRTVQRWLDQIPVEMVRESPRLMMFCGRISQTGELDKALECYDHAIEGFQRLGEMQWVARSLAKRSTVRRLMGRRTEAVDDYRRVLELAGDDAEVEAEARKGLGIIAGMQGRFSESVPELKRSLVIYERLGSVYQMAELNKALGMTHYSKGDLSTAFQYWRHALSLWEKLDNHWYAADILNDLAMVSYWRGEYEEALKTLREALGKVRESGYLRVEAYIQSSMGTVLRDIGDFDKALKAYEDALDLARKVNEGLLITQLLNDIGDVYRLRGDMVKAERFVRQASFQASEYGALRESALYELSLGLIAYDRGNHRQAAAHLSRSCRGLKASGAQREQARAHYHMANILLSQGRDAEALKQMRSVDQLVESLGYETFLFADAKRAPRPVEFAAEKGLGLSWVERLRQKLFPDTKPVATTQTLKDATDHPVSSGLVPVKVFALGQGKVVCGTREVTDNDWSTQIAKELLYFLLSQPRGARREEVMEALWPELSHARANSSFHVALYRLRRATFPELFIHQGGRYLLNPNVDVWFDVEEFERCVNKALSSGTKTDAAAPYWERAVSVYQGEFLSQFYSEWCETKRRGLEERYLQALIALARYYVRQGDFSASISCYEKAIETDLYTEDLHRQLIKVYHMAGDRPSAVRHYNRLVKTLREEMGSEPEPETVMVYNSLLRETSGSTEAKGAKRRNENLR